MQKILSIIKSAAIGLLTLTVLLTLTLGIKPTMLFAADVLTPIFRTLTVKPSKALTDARGFTVYAQDGTNFFGIATNAATKIALLGTNYTGFSTNVPIWKTNTSFRIVNGLIVDIQ